MPLEDRIVAYPSISNTSQMPSAMVGLSSTTRMVSFAIASHLGKVDQALAAAAELGIKAIEFMNLAEPIPPKWYAEHVKAAEANDIAVIFEYYPHRSSDGALRPASRMES